MALSQALYDDDRVDSRTRELIFLGVQSALRLPAAVKVHTERALLAGATADEITAALLLPVANAGMNGPLECLPVALEVIAAQQGDVSEGRPGS